MIARLPQAFKPPNEKLREDLAAACSALADDMSDWRADRIVRRIKRHCVDLVASILAEAGVRAINTRRKPIVACWRSSSGWPRSCTVVVYSRPSPSLWGARLPWVLRLAGDPFDFFLSRAQEHALGLMPAWLRPQPAPYRSSLKITMLPSELPAFADWTAQRIIAAETGGQAPPSPYPTDPHWPATGDYVFSLAAATEYDAGVRRRDELRKARERRRAAQ